MPWITIRTSDAEFRNERKTGNAASVGWIP